MPPADNSRFVLTNVMVRSVIVFVGGLILSVLAFYVKTGDLKQALIDGLMAAVGGGAVPRIGEGLGMDFSRSVKAVPPVNKGDVAAYSAPLPVKVEGGEVKPL